MSAAQSARLRPERRLLALLLALVPVAVRATEFPESADQPSAFVTVIEAREYDDRFETVEDLLQHVAGVRVRRFGGLGTYSTASIRGSKAEQVLVLLDGVRLNSSYRGQVDLSTLDLRTVERIEVVRGSGASRYGSDPIGGVISITSRKAEGDEVELGAVSGSAETRGVDLALARAGMHWSGALAYSRLRSENDFEFEIAPEPQGRAARRPNGDERHRRLNADFVANTGALSASLSTGRQSEVVANLHFHQKNNGQPGSLLGKPTVEVPDEVLSCPHGDERYRRVITRLGWKDESFGRGVLEAAGFYRHERSVLHDSRGRCDYFSSLVFADRRTRAQLIESQGGVELNYASRPLRLGPFGLVNRSSTILRVDRVRSEDVDPMRRWTGTFFTREEIRFLGGRIRLLPALALDLANTSGGQAQVVGFRDPVDVNLDDDPEWLPQIGAIVRLAPGLQLKSNYQRAYRRPNFSELFHPDYGFIRGNPELQPEEAWNFDVGLELGHDGWGPFEDLRLEGAFFHRDIEDSIEWLNVGTTFMPLNTGGASSRGYELSGSLTLWRHLDLVGTYTHLDTEINLTGNPLPHTPQNQFFGRAALRLGGSRIWIEVTHEDEFFLNEGGRREAPEATQIDAGISVRLADLPGLRWLPGNLRLSSEWTNLTEAERLDSLGLPLPDETLWYLRIHRGPR